MLNNNNEWVFYIVHVSFQEYTKVRKSLILIQFQFNLYMYFTCTIDFVKMNEIKI